MGEIVNRTLSRVYWKGIIHDSIIKRWDKDITIYIEKGSAIDRKEVLEKLKGTVALLSPSLNNKVKISLTNEKHKANYVIDLDYHGRSGCFLKWDVLGNIYSCVVRVNTRDLFNYEHPAIASNVSVWRQDINDIDLRILKLHYGDDIKPGMAEKDIDQYFDSHRN